MKMQLMMHEVQFAMISTQANTIGDPLQTQPE